MKQIVMLQFTRPSETFRAARAAMHLLLGSRRHFPLIKSEDGWREKNFWSGQSRFWFPPIRTRGGRPERSDELEEQQMTAMVDLFICQKYQFFISSSVVPRDESKSEQQNRRFDRRSIAWTTNRIVRFASSFGNDLLLSAFDSLRQSFVLHRCVVLLGVGVGHSSPRPSRDQWRLDRSVFLPVRSRMCSARFALRVRFSRLVTNVHRTDSAQFARVSPFVEVSCGRSCRFSTDSNFLRVGRSTFRRSSSSGRADRSSADANAHRRSSASSADFSLLSIFDLPLPIGRKRPDPSNVQRFSTKDDRTLQSTPLSAVRSTTFLFDNHLCVAFSPVRNLIVDIFFSPFSDRLRMNFVVSDD